MLLRQAASDSRPSPSPSAPADGETTQPAALQAEFKLAGVIGERLAEPLGVMNRVIDSVAQNRAISAVQMRQLQQAVTQAVDVARQSQQIARLATGRLRQSHERIQLDQVLRDLLRARTPALQQAGVELHQNLKPVEVIIDPTLLCSLLDAALDWAVSLGKRLVIRLDIKNWPEHGMLQFNTSDSVVARSEPGATVGHSPEGGGEKAFECENLSWFLLAETARAMGVPVEKTVSAQGLGVTLEFSRTVKRLSGMTAVEMDTGFDSLNGESRPMAGLRLLVVTNDELLRMEIVSVARNMGLVVDFAPSTAQAMRYCEMDPPHLVVIDERIRDGIFDELMAALRQTDPTFPFVEIAKQCNTLEVAGWMSDSMTRLSRDALRSQLPSILVLELAKVV